MALNPSMADPCSILNSTDYPTLWIRTNTLDTDAYPKIAERGVSKTYLESLNAISASGKNLPVVSPSEPNSKFRLLQFMSGGGIASGAKDANGAEIRYNHLSRLALSTGTTQPIYESIVDTYIMSTKGINKTNYSFPQQGVPALTDSEIWNPADDTSTTSTKTSILGKLIAEKHLLSASELFTQNQLTDSAIPPPNTESLVYLYKQDQGRIPLTAEQNARKTMLEARNLRFFGAFLCEYCFYRTRYEWLLAKYFMIYTMPTSGTNTFNIGQHLTGVAALFVGVGTGSEIKHAGPQPTQQELITAMAYQMACLNTRMTDMRSLLGAINTYYNGVFTNIQEIMNDANLVGSNSELTKTIQSLQMSASDANSYLTQTEFTKSVMEYNSEKNRYSNILLGLYAFLNIAALATIFQLARSP
jgi:hypothetical protein